MFNDIIEKELTQKGASLVGFADLDMIPNELRKNLPHGIIIAKALDPQIVSNIPTGPHMDYYNAYKDVSNKLNDMCEFTSQLIEGLGFHAFPQSRRFIKQNEQWRTPLPHKTVATLAGIGWIGKSAVLVTKKYGCAIRLTSVLTDLPLTTGIPIKSSECGTCMECTKHCPGRAVKGINWEIATDRDELLNPSACKNTVRKRGEPFHLEEGTCGVCIAVCPFTQRYIKASHYNDNKQV